MISSDWFCIQKQEQVRFLSMQKAAFQELTFPRITDTDMRARQRYVDPYHESRQQHALSNVSDLKEIQTSFAQTRPWVGTWWLQKCRRYACSIRLKLIIMNQRGDVKLRISLGTLSGRDWSLVVSWESHEIGRVFRGYQPSFNGWFYQKLLQGYTMEGKEGNWPSPCVPFKRNVKQWPRSNLANL